MRRLIPNPVVSVLSDIIPQAESHASIDSLFNYADAPGDPPPGVSKPVKVAEWLRRTNKDETVDPLTVLGRLVERYIDFSPHDDFEGFKAERAKRVTEALQRAGLRYVGNGTVTSIDAPQVRVLQDEIKKLNVESIDYEFRRALENVRSDPYEAVSAACNLLESIFKVIIEQSGTEMPKVQDLGGLWKVIKRELGLDVSQLGDQDLMQILTGLSGVISGIAALRTHTSSAHGRGQFRYTLRSRHVLLAIHSAHALAVFVLQTWQEKKKQPSGPS